MLDASARLLQLLSLLQARRFWRGDELAERLGVTPRTIRRDVDRLRSLGYMVAATAGLAGGYQLGRGNQMPPVVLDEKESVTVCVALRCAAQTLTDFEQSTARLLAKLEQLMPDRARAKIEALSSESLTLGRASALIDPTILTTLALAARERRCAVFDYPSTRGGEAKPREVEPLHLVHTGNRRWYLVAWDRLKQDFRTFRVDKVASPPVLGEVFVPRELPASVEDYVATTIAARPYPYVVEVILQGAKADLESHVPPWCGALSEVDATRCRLVTGAPHLDALVCQLILTGVDFEVVGNDGLAEHLRTVAARLTKAADGLTRQRGAAKNKGSRVLLEEGSGG